MFFCCSSSCFPLRSCSSSRCKIREVLQHGERKRKTGRESIALVEPKPGPNAEPHGEERSNPEERPEPSRGPEVAGSAEAVRQILLLQVLTTTLMPARFIKALEQMLHGIRQTVLSLGPQAGNDLYFAEGSNPRRCAACMSSASGSSRGPKPCEAAREEAPRAICLLWLRRCLRELRGRAAGSLEEERGCSKQPLRVRCLQTMPSGPETAGALKETAHRPLNLLPSLRTR